MKILGLIYLSFIVVMGLFFFLTLIIENNLDNCNPIKKWWRKHIMDYDPTEPRPQGTTCDE